MATPATRGIGPLFKKAWHEIPEIVGSSFFAVAGIIMCIGANVYYYKNDMQNRPYRQHYTVYRHDDPRVKKLKTEYVITEKPL